MADEQNLTSETEPLGNDPAARNPDGSLKSAPSSSPETTSTGTQETKSEPKVVPETYEFKAVEGQPELSAELLAEATPIFKDLGLSQDEAQRLVDFHNAQMKKAVDSNVGTMMQMREDWRKEITNDSAYGNGKGELKPEVIGRIGKAIDSLPEALRTPFREAMDLTGAGNHPAFIRAFDALAQRLGEGTSVPGTTPSRLGQTAKPNGAVSAASALFPNLPSAT